MEWGLFPDHKVCTEQAGSMAQGLSMVASWSSSVTPPFFTWRSGDDVTDGGHTKVPSIGQAIGCFPKIAVSSTCERSGKAHIVPIT